MKSAIRQYSAIIEKFKSDRPVAADALLRLAQCYEKLGDAQAKAVYERLVRDYADQKDAAAFARARLVNRQPIAQAKGERAVWTGPLVDLFGQVSPDGRYITYVDWANTGNVMLHDVVYDDKGPHTQSIYIAPLQDGGHQHVRRLVEATDDVSYFDPHDWSPGGGQPGTAQR